MSEKEVKMRKDGLPKQPLTVFEKIVIVISVVLVLATAVVGTLKFGFTQLEHTKDFITQSVLNPGEKQEIDKKWLVLGNKIMPESIELENGDGIKFNVRMEFNTEFTSEGAKGILDYLNIVNIYDEKGNQLKNEDKLKVGSSEIPGQQLKVMAMIELLTHLSKVKEVVNNVLVVLVILDIICGVLIAYFIWRRADDRRELREAMMREAETRKVLGETEEEIKASKKKKKKKKK